jgi:hypothetical protein
MTIAHFERCNRKAADMAMKIVEMLNHWANNALTLNEKLNEFSTGCMSCHGPGKEKADVSAGMSCDTCHENPHRDNVLIENNINLENWK